MVEQELVRASDRRARIAQMLREGRRLQVADLVHEFGVTDTSIRRDLAILEANGVLLRVHGGAVARASETRPKAVTDRMRLHLAEKQRIGEAAAKLVGPGEIILLDSGTTTLQVATHIPATLRTASMLTIITNSLRLAEEVLTWPAPNLILLGGLCVPDYQAIVGAQALEQLEHVMVDKVFLGIDGLTMTDGATTADILMAEINRRMAERAHQVILVTDSSKLGRAGFEPIVRVNQIHRLITDTGAPEALVKELRGEGVQVDCV
jgi:DeoR family transcriptional regulator, aga operon transcriptional repressor